jgi:tRNA G10  N-methylase Trm11
MTSYLFILGRTPLLAFLELKTFLPDATLIGEGVAIAANTVPIDKLGGTVKIAEIIGHTELLTPEALAPYVDSQIFGFSFYPTTLKPSRTLLEGIKTILVRGGRHVRFVESRNGSQLSSVVIQKQQVQEYMIVKQHDGYYVGKTIDVQPFEDWNRRDYGRPYADPKAGMLPPKVSRMVVNIADRSRDVSQPLSQKTLLDPFCGMGTILAEALVMGWNVVGSDQSSEVLDKCRVNLRWLTEKRLAADGVTYRLQSSDAVHVSDLIDKESIDAIATEPFMGPPKIADAKNIIKGLEKLYIGCLRDWRVVLKPQGMVMMALPMYELGGKIYFVKKVIDMCETLGYTIVTGPIEYSRPQAIVKRTFYLFQKKYNF